MHCPRCGQKQVSEEIKFCSRCGFPLGLVAEILSHGGFLPQLAELYKKKQPKITKRNGIYFSLFWFMFFVFMMTPFWGIVDVDEMAAFSAITGVFGSLMIFLASLIFLKNPAKELPPGVLENQQTAATNLYGTNQNTLPPSQSIPVDSYMPPTGSWKAPETGELAQPHSVVDNTTKLLNKDR